jgi:hypothetical protein
MAVNARDAMEDEGEIWSSVCAKRPHSPRCEGKVVLKTNSSL